MPIGTVPFSVSQDFAFSSAAVDQQIADSSIGGVWTRVDMTIVVSDLSGVSTSFGLFAAINGGGFNSTAYCVVTPALGTAFTFSCDLSNQQPSSIQLWVYPRGPGPFPRTLRVNATGTFSFSAAGDCAYGTRAKAGATFAYFLTPGIIDTLLAPTPLVWAAPFLTALWFTAIDFTGICGSGPGPMPVLDKNISTWSIDQATQFLKSVAWFSLCECIPGTPPPIPFPPPNTPAPPGLPVPPIFPCSDVDPCAALIQLQRSVAAIAASVASTNTLVTLLQRYNLPFAYILGASHLNIQGTGSFALPTGLLGLMLTIDVIPPGTPTLIGTPAYNENLGWVSVLDTNGFIDEKRLTRTPHIWIPRIMQDVSKFGYNLSTGVTLRVTELQAEP